jgi:hypothetical protein
MIRFKFWAGFWKEALSVLANSMLKLFFTRRTTKIGGRSSYIMNISFKILLIGKLFCLSKNRTRGF